MLFVLPLVAGTVTYLLLREMSQLPSIGEPKTPVEIRRGIDGSFAFGELALHEVDEEILELPEEVAYRSLVGGNGNGHAPHVSEDGEERSSEVGDEHGVFEVPRD